MVTSRDVTARIAEILPGWRFSDLRTRERWLIQAGIVPKGKPGRGGGAAPITLRHALLYILSLGAPTAVGAPKYVRRTAGSRGNGGQTLIETLENDARHSIAIQAAHRNEDTETGARLAKDSVLVSLELPCRDGKTRHAASIRWVNYRKGKGLITEDYVHASRPKRLAKTDGKNPKPPRRGEPFSPDRFMPTGTHEPHAMRWVRMDHAVIDGVAALFAEPTGA